MKSKFTRKPGPVSPKERGFLNVDLEIDSTTKLEPLVKELEDKVFILYSGPGPNPKHHFLVVESKSEHKDPDSAIRALCSIVEELPPASRRIWAKAKKVFDVGYIFDPEGQSMGFSLETKTLQRITGCRAKLAMTCYGNDFAETI